MIKEYLTLMNEYSYEEYLEARNSGIIVFEKEYDFGFMYVKDNTDSYGIRISFNKESYGSLFEDLVPFIAKEKVYILFNSLNKEVKEFFSNYKVMYYAYEMKRSLEGFTPYTDTVDLIKYDHSYFDESIRVLRSFEPVRRALGLEPYDWYKHNKEEAKKNFDEKMKRGDIFLYKDDTVKGVLMLEKAEVDTISVLMTQQGKGIGSKLLKTGINILHSRMYKEISLGVLSHNEKAISIYKKHGFITTGNLCVLES